MVFPKASNEKYRYVTIKGCMAGEDIGTESEFNIYIYEKDCTEAAFIDFVADHTINMYIDSDGLTGERT